eukprot:TRINITY_DN980_c0_g2_i8.p1 TRINITY_DN980_c0_g2~~TRINITY_DN980_c0_g2_i8.p1  ORF type:complete len:532 (+),score=119.26 TRINITY_DN980_c0_g2_i8:113-1708(+)
MCIRDSFNDSNTMEEIRNEERQLYFYPEDAELPDYIAMYNIENDVNLNAWLSIMRTWFVCIILLGGALLFSQDATELVLTPIESMLEKVQRIARNPIEAAQSEEEAEFLMQEAGVDNSSKDDKKKKKETYETQILEKTITKIGALLALGFGEAGSEIIAQNMGKEGDVDPIIPGRKIVAIFGFCDIRNFTDATEVLQEGVMVFVNEIAEIVHGTVDDYGGSANKNIGDAFLLVWKFPNSDIMEDPEKPGDLKLKGTLSASQVADMSVFSFIKIMAGINKSEKLEKYKRHKGLNERMPNYSVKMGFGLHVGWAIEGAIGSEFKIDASYLSPNVNMASRLEAATKQFGVPMLISGPLFKILSPDFKEILRHIDRVKVKGSDDPIDFYTCDLTFAKLGTVTPKKPGGDRALTKKEKKRQKFLKRVERERRKQKAFTGKETVGTLMKKDKDIKLMRSIFTPEFKTIFNTGLEAYLKGDWPAAKQVFEQTLDMIPGHKDGPSNTLLDVIESHGGRAPSDWEGVRVLTEKQKGKGSD